MVEHLHHGASRRRIRRGRRPSHRERFWDFPVAKIDSPTRQPMCPGRPASAARSHAPLVRGIPRLPHWLDGARMRFAARPLARKRTPALLNRLAPTGDYWPRASPFHGQQRLQSGCAWLDCFTDFLTDRLFSQPQFIRLLQIHPVIGRGTEVAGQA